MPLFPFGNIRVTYETVSVNVYYCTVSSNILVTLITNSSVKFLHVIHEIFNVNSKFFFNNCFLKQVSCREFNNKFRRLENIFKAKLQNDYCS